MQKIILNLLLIFSSLVVFSQKKKEIKKHGIKTIISIETHGTKTFTDLKSTYNSKGQLIEEVNYDKEGVLKSTTKFKYNIDDDVIEELEYDEKNVLKEKRLFKYSLLKEKIEELVLDKDGKQLKKNVYTYDSKGLKIERKTYDANNTLVITKNILTVTNNLNPVNDILKAFAPITLKEMDSVKLMDRTDTKYTFKLELLPKILEDIEPFYKCLHIETKIISNYQTLYYDTKNLMLYNKHHNGQLNRYKIRHRTYVDSSLGYLEVKFKNNKGRTVKDRIQEKEPATTFNDKSYAFLSKELPFDPHTLTSIVWVNYSRITLVNRSSAERVTIDLNLEFIKGEQIVNLDNLVIAEVKQEKKTPSPFIKTMKKLRIREGSISKYCFAVAFTCSNAKKNNFKEKLLSLKHIINHDTITNIYRSHN